MRALATAIRTFCYASPLNILALKFGLYLPIFRHVSCLVYAAMVYSPPNMFDFFRSRDSMNTCRLLHVEDEPDIREVVQMSLALDPGIVLKSCACGADALVAAAEWEPDIILMDMMMPVMDGAATLNHLRANARTSKIPVVFMTARAQSREVQHFLSLGAAGVIPKPFDPMLLAKAVRNYLPGNGSSNLVLSGAI